MTAIYTNTAYAMWVLDSADMSTYCVLVLFCVRRIVSVGLSSIGTRSKRTEQ